MSLPSQPPSGQEARAAGEQLFTFKMLKNRVAWPAQMEECAMLDFGGREFEPHIRCRNYLKKFF